MVTMSIFYIQLTMHTNKTKGTFKLQTTPTFEFFYLFRLLLFVFYLNVIGRVPVDVV